MRKSRLVICILVSLFVVGLFGFNYALAASKRHIFIAGGRTSSFWYPFTQALAKFVNEKSEWLELEAVSTAGLTANVDLVKEKPTEYMGVMSWSHIHYWPGHAWSEKRGHYTGFRFIANSTSGLQLLITYDPDIKSVQDLIGKVVDLGRRGAVNTPDMEAILEAHGVLDKVKIMHTGYGGGAKKLKDGMADASFLMLNYIYPDKFSKGSFVEMLETKGPAYYIGFDRDKLLALRDKEHSTLPVKIPAGAFDPKTQPKMLWGFDDPVLFFADVQMDEKVVHEITRIIWETPTQEWAKWHPTGAHMNEKFKPAMPSLTLCKPHPGAKKYYDENGIALRDLADLLK